MNKNDIDAVFFDCWDTLISFECNEKRWNILSLYEHSTNKEKIDWQKVYDFSEEFFSGYYRSRLNYEVDVLNVLNLFVTYFDIELDCPLEVCTHEILIHLDPKPIDGIDEFLTYLDKNDIYYAVLSNTIYSADDTLALINKLIPGHHFGFFLGSKDIGVKKPNPIFFQTGVKKAKKEINKSMYIGDTFYQDVIGSYSAGFSSSVWLNHKRKTPTFFERTELVDKIQYIEVDSYHKLISEMKEKNTK